MSESVAPTVFPAPGSSVHLMLTCLCDAFYPGVALSTAQILEHFGYSVVFDERQTCCAQPAFNCGDRRSALGVARHVLKIFDGANAVIVPSGSCAAMIRWGYPQLFRNQPDLERALALARRTWELSEFLIFVAKSTSWPGHYDRRIAFHRSCHMRELLPGAGPESLLASIDGLQILPVRHAEQCCGFGGTFAVTFPWASARIGASKLDELTLDTPQEIVSSDMGCLMHLSGLDGHRQDSSARLVFRHYAEVLAESLANQKARNVSLT